MADEQKPKTPQPHRPDTKRLPPLPPEDLLKSQVGVIARRLDQIHDAQNELRTAITTDDEGIPADIKHRLRIEGEIGRLQGLSEGVSSTMQVMLEIMQTNSKELLLSRERVSVLLKKVDDIDERGQLFARTLDDFKALKTVVESHSDFINEVKEEEKRSQERRTKVAKWAEQGAKVILIVLAVAGGANVAPPLLVALLKIVEQITGGG